MKQQNLRSPLAETQLLSDFAKKTCFLFVFGKINRFIFPRVFGRRLQGFPQNRAGGAKSFHTSSL